MKKLIYFLLVVAISAAMIILYQNQLGAISFFILSIFFFVLAIKGLSGGAKGTKGKVRKKKAH